MDRVYGCIASFAALALLLGCVPSLVMYALLGSAVQPDGAPAFTAPAYWISLVVTMIASTILQATLVRSAVLDLGGCDPEIVPSLGVALSLLLPMIGLTILVSILTLLGTLLLIVPGIIVYIMLSVAVPALVEERRGVVASMKRSRALTAGSKGRIFLLMLLFGIVYVVIVMVIGFLFGAIGTADLTVAAIGQAVSAGVFSLLLAAMLASLYVELRTVKEGATTEGLAAIFE